MKYFFCFVLTCFLLFPLSACSVAPPYDGSDLLGNGFFTSPPPHKTTAPTATQSPSPTAKPSQGGGGGGSIIVPTPKPVTTLSSPTLSLSTTSLTWNSVPNADTYAIFFQHQLSLDNILTKTVYTSATSHPLNLIDTNFVGLVTITAESNNPLFSSSLSSAPITLASTLPENFSPTTQVLFITSSPKPTAPFSVKITSNLPSLSIAFAQSFFAKNFSIISPTSTKITLSTPSSTAQLSATDIIIDAPLASVYQEISFVSNTISVNVSKNSLNINAPISTSILNINGGKVKLNASNSNIDLISSTALTAELDVNVSTTLNLSSSASLVATVNANNATLNLSSHSGGTFPNIYVKSSNVSINNNSAFIKNLDIGANAKNTTIINSSHINTINNLSSTTVYAKTDSANTNISFSGVNIKIKQPLFLSGITAIDRQYNLTTSVSLSGIFEFTDGDGNVVTGVELTAMAKSSALSQTGNRQTSCLNYTLYGDICTYNTYCNKCNIQSNCLIDCQNNAICELEINSLAKFERVYNTQKPLSFFGTMLDKNIGTNKIVVPHLKLADSFSVDYVLIIKPILVNISSLPLSVKPSTFSTPYNGTASLSVFNLALLNEMTEDVKLFSGEIYAEASSKNVGLTNLTSVSGNILTGADAKNYSVDPSNIAVEIVKAPLFNVTTTLAKKYNDGTLHGKISESTILGVIDGDVVSVNIELSTATYDTILSTTSANALITLAISGADSSNYTPPAKFYLRNQIILKNDEICPIIYGVMFFLDANLLEYYVCEIVSSTSVTLDFSNKFFDYPISKIVAPLYCDYVTTIILPDTLGEICDDAFTNCSNLTSVIVSESNPYFTLIDGELFTKDLSKKIFSPNK